ncbi:hypothetical protein HanXRQr2_Chr04g0159181 [Helianthus annuus]|uniref:Secreted protein n=1 Tax=Helianthus annuus TaxID=4232 RepID=A0A251UYS5_HELAN|nr:uncharacterized protein LOC110936262 [Helianthus annuus]KAF5809606.1 hypothetical protein HanXRQr2_Chr04g0159181 [Helianthus annuus]
MMVLMMMKWWCWPTAALTAGAMPSTAVAVMVVVLFTFQVCGLVQVQLSVGSGDISGLGSVRFNKTGYGSNLVHLGSRYGSGQSRSTGESGQPGSDPVNSVSAQSRLVKIGQQKSTVKLGKRQSKQSTQRPGML